MIDLFTRIPGELSSNILILLNEEDYELKVLDWFAKQVAFENAAIHSLLPILKEILSQEQRLILSA